MITKSGSIRSRVSSAARYLPSASSRLTTVLPAMWPQRFGNRWCGYSMALHNAWPDMGFLTQTEVARIASMVASATTLPVIADADDGYGNALSTIRTVQEFMK